MGKLSRAIGGIALCLLVTAPLEARPLRVTPVPGRIAPERFYAIPLSRVERLSRAEDLRAKITCCKWGPWALDQRPNIRPGQWYIYPVCRRELILSETLVGEDTQTIPVPCP